MAERMDHEKMRRAAHPTSDAQSPEAGAHEPIPGEHDRSTEAPTQPGIVGTTGYGADTPPVPVDSTLDEDKKQQTRWEGGGRGT